MREGSSRYLAMYLEPTTALDPRCNRPAGSSSPTPMTTCWGPCLPASTLQAPCMGAGRSLAAGSISHHYHTSRRP